MDPVEGSQVFLLTIAVVVGIAGICVFLSEILDELKRISKGEK